MTKFQNFLVSESVLYKCTLLITIQLKGSIVIVTLKFSFTAQSHSTNFIWQSKTPETSQNLPRMFPCGQNYANLYLKSCYHLNVKVVPKHEFENLLCAMLPQHTRNLSTKLVQMLTSLVSY